MPLLFLKGNSGKSTGSFQATDRNSSSSPINFLPVFLLLAILAITWKLIFGYQDKALTLEEIEKSLSPEELEAFHAEKNAVDEKFENCIQYILYALKDGRYQCASCPPGIPFVTLKKGDIWYIGHTCQEEDERHSQAFQKSNGVWMFTNYVGSKEECHKLELKLIRAYKFLPESVKPETKLILPPYNRTDKN